MCEIRANEIHGTTDCEWSMVGEPCVSDASPYAVDGGMSGMAAVEVEIEVGNKWCIGCTGRLKRGSEGQNNIGEGRLLVLDDQT